MRLRGWNPGRPFRRGCFAAAYAALLILLPGVASAGDFAFVAAYDFATSTALSQFVSTEQCNSPTCSLLPFPGGGTGQVNTSDWAMSQAIEMDNLAPGEVVSWQVTEPDGSNGYSVSLTYDSASDCFIVSDGSNYCGRGGYLGLNVWYIINS